MPPAPARWTLRTLSYRWDYGRANPIGRRVVVEESAPQPVQSLSIDYDSESVVARYETADGERHMIEAHEPDRMRATGRRVLFDFTATQARPNTIWIFTQVDR